MGTLDGTVETEIELSVDGVADVVEQWDRARASTATMRIKGLTGKKMERAMGIEPT
jgi:hypothetical protein